jgi:hypothetical protein
VLSHGASTTQGTIAWEGKYIGGLAQHDPQATIHLKYNLEKRNNISPVVVYRSTVAHPQQASAAASKEQGMLLKAKVLHNSTDF